jgi:hypothetical protein
VSKYSNVPDNLKNDRVCEGAEYFSLLVTVAGMSPPLSDTGLNRQRADLQLELATTSQTPIIPSPRRWSGYFTRATNPRDAPQNHVRRGTNARKSIRRNEIAAPVLRRVNHHNDA